MKSNYFGPAASALGLVLASPAWSQTPPPPGATAAAEPGILQEVVVTAQKRSESAQKVPISIVAVGGAALANSGISNTAEIGSVAAGVNVRVVNSSFLPYIRGIGTNSVNTESPASVYVDGVYLPYSRGALSDLADVTQLTILKGPQGTLFGRNSTAGVIQISTRNPTQARQFEADESIDNYETSHSSIYITGGLTDDLAANFSGEYGTQGIGWGKDHTTGDDTHRLDRDVNLRAKLLYEPGSNTTITAVGQYFDQKFVEIAYVPYPGTTPSYPGEGPLNSVYDSYSGNDGYLRNKGYSGSITVKQNLGFADLLSISAYQNLDARLLFDAGGTAAALVRVAGDQPSHVFTQELQLASHTSSALKWVVGAYYFNNHEYSSPSTTQLEPPFGFFPVSYIRRDGAQFTESLAGFAQGTLEVIQDTHLTLGARYTWEKRDFSGVQVFQPFVPISAPGTFGAQETQSISKPSFRIALDHQFTRDVLGYISFNNSFKSGGYNLISPLAKPYLPEDITAYEAGLKTQLLDRRMQLNATLFYYNYNNIQVSQVINNLSIVSNAAKARTYGLDLDMRALVTDHLQISGALGLLNAEYTDYPNAQLASPLAAGGATIGSFNAAGKQLPGAQKVSGNLAVDYDTALAETKVHYNVTAAYQGESFLEPDNFIRQPGYVTLNSSIKFTLPDNHVSITIFGKNLIDAHVITAGNSTAQLVSVNYDDAPRTYGVAFHYKY